MDEHEILKEKILELSRTIDSQNDLLIKQDKALSLAAKEEREYTRLFSAYDECTLQ